MKRILFFIALLTVTLTVTAQQPVHDSQKEHQIRSMEQGHWDFSPDWWRVVFKESDSNVKTIAPRREKQVAVQALKQQIIEKERKKIEELNNEEIARAADRNSDLVYGKYKELFTDMQSSITEGLTYCMIKSKGKMAGSIKELTDRNEVITSNIAYLRKTGVGYELENAKRERGFAKAKKDMEELVKKVTTLARLAKAFY